MCDNEKAPAVPASRVFTVKNHELRVLPGEQVMIGLCCEKCGHTQRGWVRCEDADWPRSTPASAPPEASVRVLVKLARTDEWLVGQWVPVGYSHESTDKWQLIGGGFLGASEVVEWKPLPK